MTEVERRAHRHLMSTMKATLGRSDAGEQEEARRHTVHSRWLSDDPEVLQLTSDGVQGFAERTANRLLAEQRDAVFLNYCPRCHELARTPKAQQCRFCGHDWHHTSEVPTR
jgi:hypothetical protein